MLSFKIKLTSTPVSVNPSNITHVVEKLGGCVIYFVGGGSIHVAESYDEVVTALNK